MHYQPLVQAYFPAWHPVGAISTNLQLSLTLLLKNYVDTQKKLYKPVKVMENKKYFRTI